MARIRTIKPDFWTSEQIVECSTNARLMFIGLWSFADDSGVHPANPRRIKMEIFPGDDFSNEDISGFLEELKSNDLLTVYTVEDVPYLRITGWDKHQRIDQATYRFPLEDGVIPETKIRRRSSNVQRTLDECSRLDRIGKERKGGDNTRVRANPQKKEDKNNGKVDAFLSEVERETGKPGGGPAPRAFAGALLNQLEKTFPDLDPVQAAGAIVRGCLALKHQFHSPRASDMKHLAQSWQEIVASCEQTSGAKGAVMELTKAANRKKVR